MKISRCFEVLALLAFVMMSGCKGTATSTETTTSTTSTSSTSTTTTTIPLQCETDHTAQVVFYNASAANLTLDIIWDGSKVTTLWPGTTSQTYDMKAGSHTLTFNVAGTDQVACSLGTVNLVPCIRYVYPCRT